MTNNNASTFKALRAPNPPEFQHTRRVGQEYPKGLPENFAASYARDIDMQRGDDRDDWSRDNTPRMSKARRLLMIGSAAVAVAGGTTLAVRSADTQNHNAAVAAGLAQPASVDAENLANGSKGVAIVTEPVGVTERTAAADIANAPSIQQVQGLVGTENGSTITNQSEVAIPINDLNQRTLGTLPNGAKVTIPELDALQSGSTLAQAEQAHAGN